MILTSFRYVEDERKFKGGIEVDGIIIDEDSMQNWPTHCVFSLPMGLVFEQGRIE